jgi:hypothetical protein
VRLLFTGLSAIALSAALTFTAQAAEFNYLGKWILTNCEELSASSSYKGLEQTLCASRDPDEFTFRKKIMEKQEGRAYEVRYILDEDILLVESVGSVPGFPEKYTIVDNNTIQTIVGRAQLYGTARLTYSRAGSPSANQPYKGGSNQSNNSVSSTQNSQEQTPTQGQSASQLLDVIHHILVR